MRPIGDGAAVELFVLEDTVVGVLLDPWGCLAISAGRSGLRVRLNAGELRDLAGRMTAAADAAERAPARLTPGIQVGHA